MKRYDFPTTDNGSWYSDNGLDRNGQGTSPSRPSSYASEHASRPGYTGSADQQANVEYTSYVWFLDDETYEYLLQD